MSLPLRGYPCISYFNVFFFPFDPVYGPYIFGAPILPIQQRIIMGLGNKIKILGSVKGKKSAES